VTYVNNTFSSTFLRIVLVILLAFFSEGVIILEQTTGKVEHRKIYDYNLHYNIYIGHKINVISNYIMKNVSSRFLRAFRIVFHCR
jgi:hypothetical protein